MQSAKILNTELETSSDGTFASILVHIGTLSIIFRGLTSQGALHAVLKNSAISLGALGHRSEFKFP
jgi:hypothetical protein